MNDSTKRIEPQGHLPRSFDDSGRPLLKADMPLWETPKYLQEDAFPIPKETAPAQLEKERPRPEGPRAGAAKKPPKAPPPPKSPAEKQKPEAKGKKAALHSDTAAEGYIRRSSIQSWFNTFMIMNIPIIGWIAAGIAIVIAVIQQLWDKCYSFRVAVFTAWERNKSHFRVCPGTDF